MPKPMQALVVRRPRGVSVDAWEEAEPQGSDIALKVAACGVCGTDRHIADGTYPATYPNVLGHEFAGTVAAVGPTADKFVAGDSVAIDPNIACHECTPCRRGDVHLCERLEAIGVTRPGAMAPHIVVPQAQAYKVPAGVSLRDAAFAEPLSCVIHGVERVVTPLGASAVILGAGSIGLLMLQVLRSVGASSVTISEPSSARRSLAEELGANEVYTPEMMEHASHTAAYDVVVDCTGAPAALQSAVRLARRGADILLFGVAPAKTSVPIEPYELYRKELRLAASNINPFTMEKAVVMLAERTVEVDKIVSDRVELADLPKLLLGKPAPDEVKIALEFA
ncbi:MAG: hypothetical protein DLM53_00095 [Candidatus Eremiobacter antarcticus]|nr:MAG: hypothetical protein DLM53_00095 [Candidatus Eremiobacter sp. RRmetagenome_bin22]